jgi:hypothetical protein
MEANLSSTRPTREQVRQFLESAAAAFDLGVTGILLFVPTIALADASG